jgi:hypothetical protein
VLFDIVQYSTLSRTGIMFPCYCLSLLLQENTAKITAALHSDGSVMPWPVDDISLFTSTPAWRAYHSCKKLMLVPLIQDEDFAQSSAALLGDISAMDYIPFFSSAGVQAWQSDLTARSIYLQESSSIGSSVESEYVEQLSISLAKTVPRHHTTLFGEAQQIRRWRANCSSPDFSTSSSAT